MLAVHARAGQGLYSSYGNSKHTGEFRGLASTGKKLTYTAVAIFRIVEGKIVEGWGVYDQMDFFKKLGVIEYKGFPDEAK